MRFDTKTAEVMRKAARGPANIALRQSRIIGGRNVAPNALAGALIRGGSAGNMRATRTRGMGALGDTVTAVKSTGTSVVAGEAGTAASAAVAGMGYGAVAGPVGAAVGLVVGLVIGALLKKNYINVAQANVDNKAMHDAWPKYLAVAGQAPGRAFGLPTMEAVMKGAIFNGVFPINNQKMCFHSGCFSYPGNEDWATIFIHGAAGNGQSCKDQNCLPNAYQAWLQNRGAASVASQMTIQPVSVGTPAVSRMAVTGARVAGFRGGHMRGLRGGHMRGLGRLGAIVPDAVTLVDQYVIPMNQKVGNHWLVPTNAIQHQLLYDVADAYLATQNVQTTPYAPKAPPPVQPVLPPATVLPATPVVVPSRAGVGGASQMVPGYTIIDPTGFNGQPLYVLTTDGNTIGTITAYAMVNGQMVAVGTVTNNTAGQIATPMPALPTGPTGAVGPQPFQTPTGVLVTSPGTGAVPGTQPVVPVASSSTSLMPLLALGAAAFLGH